MEQSDHEVKMKENLRDATTSLVTGVQNSLTLNCTPNQLPALHAAILSGRLETVEHVLKNGAKIEGSPDLLPPLNAAVQSGFVDIVELLLRNGANVEGRPGHATPLHDAVEMGDCASVQLLLQYNASVNGRPDQLPPLYEAIKKGHRGIVEILLDSGADIEGVADKESPLSTAAARGHFEIVKLLLERGASLKGRFTSPLLSAVEFSHHKTAVLLLKNGANVDGEATDDVDPVYAAVQIDDFKMFRLLLDFGADKNFALSGDTERLLILFRLSNVVGGIKIPQLLMSLVMYRLTSREFLLKGCDPMYRWPVFPRPLVFRHFVERCFCNPVFVAVIDDAGKHCTPRGRIYPDHTHPDCHRAAPGIYLHHQVKLIAAALYPLAEILQDYSSFWDIIGFRLENSYRDDYKKQIMSELAQMKNSTVADTTLTFFDVLTKDLLQIARWFKNSKVAEIFSSDELYDTFPEYADILQCQFKSGKQYISATKEGVTFCHSLSNLCNKLPLKSMKKFSTI